MSRMVFRAFSTAVIAACAAVSSAAAWAAEAGAASATVTTAAPAQQTTPATVAATPASHATVLKTPVSVEIKIIHARRTGQFIDQRVRHIEKLMKPVFNFASYRLVKEEKLTLAYDADSDFDQTVGAKAHSPGTKVPMPFRLSVRMKQSGTSERKIRLHVKIGAKQSVSLRLEDGGTFIQGVTLKNGQSYILAISATSTK